MLFLRRNTNVSNFFNNFLFFFLIIIYIYIYILNIVIDGVPYEIERSCAMVGGMCVAKTDCAELTTKQGLCPDNEAKGYECCYAGKLH